MHAGRAGRLTRAGALLVLCLLLCCGVSTAETVRESRIIFLSVTACESCAKVRTQLDALPDRMTVTDAQGQQVQSSIVIEEFNINKELERAQALFASFHVSAEDQVVPAVFLTTGCYLGAEQVAANLEDALARGEGLVETSAGQAANQPMDAEAPALAVGQTLIAGLVGGLNPCALSMLLVLLSALMTAGRKAGRYAALFLGAKTVCYLLIGTVLFSAFTLIEGSWFPLTVRILTTAVSTGLIVLNVMDAVNAARERYGAIHNQLPPKTRGALRQTLQKAVNGHSGRIGAAVAVAGIVVAAGEFMCAGQVYLAALLSQVQSGVDSGRMFLLLCVYCAGFLMPSAVVTMVVVKAGNAFTTSDALRRWMPGINLVTALVLGAVLVQMWFG